MVASVNDVAKFLLEQAGSMSTMKLQKLVYYCQAYKVAWEDEPMFPESVRAWTHGPVVYELYKEHKGQFSVTADDICGDTAKLTVTDMDVAAAVLEAFGGLTGWELRNQTHQERPWLNAYDEHDVRHNQVISLESMGTYYQHDR